MSKLISMIDFVLEVLNQDRPCDRGKILDEIGNYANFLKQPLNLGMFVPAKLVDGEWVVLEEYHSIDNKNILFEQAKDNVIFEGFELENKSEFTIWLEKENHSICFTNRGKINMNGINIQTIEDLMPYNLTLTEKQAKILVL